MTDFLQTQRLTLRAPERRDEAGYVAFYGSDRRAAVAPRVPADVAKGRFADVCEHWTKKGFGRFIVENTQTAEVLGMVGPQQPDDYPEPEISWHLWSEGAEGKGIALEAAQAVHKHTFGTLNFGTVVSYIHPRNIRSVMLAEKLGAKRDADAVYPDYLTDYHVYRHCAPDSATEFQQERSAR